MITCLTHGNGIGGRAGSGVGHRGGGQCSNTPRRGEGPKVVLYSQVSFVGAFD